MALTAAGSWPRASRPTQPDPAASDNRPRLATLEIPVRFPFCQRIATGRTPDALWNTLERALDDSTQVPEWPSHLSELHRVSKDELAATYRGFGSASTYHYALEVRPEERAFRYQAIPSRHPLVGGADVAVVPTGAGSDLVWTGAYEAGLRQLPQALAFKLVFEPRFFRALRRGLEDGD